MPELQYSSSFPNKSKRCPSYDHETYPEYHQKEHHRLRAFMFWMTEPKEEEEQIFEAQGSGETEMVISKKVKELKSRQVALKYLTDAELSRANNFLYDKDGKLKDPEKNLGRFKVHEWELAIKTEKLFREILAEQILKPFTHHQIFSEFKEEMPLIQQRTISV